MDKTQDALVIGRRDHPETALRLRPDPIDVLFGLGLAPERQGRLDEAATKSHPSY